jgi:hypothetical protein
MITLRAPLLKRSFLNHTLTVSTLETGSRGIRSQVTPAGKYMPGGKIRGIELQAVLPVPVGTPGIDVTQQAPNCETGIYSDGAAWYQISFRKLGG